jgi:hypothetical protein
VAVVNLLGRLFGAAVGLDEAGNALGGGKPTETVSGTIGRGLISKKFWAKPTAALIDAIFGKGHCAAAAANEAAHRAINGV